MVLDADICYRAVRSRDRRFDGRFYTAVLTTGIYCRPSCPARTPHRRHVRFYRHAAAAELAGFRACRRCRPEISPDAPDWDIRADLVGRALRLIAQGVVDREGVRGLAARLAVGERQLRRLFVAELGAGPLAFARTRRAQLAWQLLDSTDLPVTRVAHAAGFASVRQFNATIRAVYGRSPTQLRNGPSGADDASLTLSLAYRPPFAASELLAFLAARAVPGVEQVDATSYRRTVAAGGRPATLTLRPDTTTATVQLTVDSDDPIAAAALVQRSRVLLDLDADPAAINEVLGADPLLAPLVTARPGLRLPGAFDGFEAAARIVLGQQVSLAAARTLAGRLARRAGTPLPRPVGSLTTLFPTAEQVKNADLRGLGLTAARAATLQDLAAAVTAGDIILDGSADPAQTCRRLRQIRGVGAWTVALIALRVLRDPDALAATDLGLRRAFQNLSLPGSATAISTRAERWRPWRGYAALHLWQADSGGHRTRSVDRAVA